MKPYRLQGATLGQRLRTAMKAARMSGRKLASAVGVHETTVSGWVNDRVNPEAQYVGAAARALNVDAAWLIDGDATRDGQQSATLREPVSPPYGASAVSAAIATGQRDLAAWLAEYSARLLEAAAADARRQLAGVVSGSAFTPDVAGGVPAELPHAGGTPEQKAALDRKVIEQLGGAGESGPRKKRSAG